ncbi:hypothetical protein H2201_000881 [Coniosporium apollinis]|uniref:Chromatin modification-related protein EAF6 n=2 Tax=Coniosporium TaxID=2810619 RepID=A0ABQ9P5Z1_9PEZI|nr:hypothetical protein H2199_001404 [Cladosporium sp. JES 115]KAJ9669055.1 hypothetical protein H2201_000881 [Coniosporium apollinis]
MAENAPPAASAANAKDDSARGMPYYDKLRRDLRETMQKKRILEQNMSATDDQIYKMETAYLEESTAGNIIRGFENYVKGSTSGASGAGAGTSTRRKAAINDADRIFSRSSASFMEDSALAVSAQTTPSHANTPSASFSNARENSSGTPSASTNSKAAANKKKKTGDDDESEGKPAKRGKITYGRD